MSDRPIPISELLADSRVAVVREGRSADGAGVGLDTAVKAASGAIDDAVRAACDIDLVDLLVQGWSKAHELRGYADPDQYPAARTIRMVLAKHPLKLAIDPELRLQALPLIDWPLKLVIELEALIDAATLVINAGRIGGVDLGTVELSAGLRWGETKVPLPLRKRELTLPGKFRIDPGVAIPRIG